MEVDGCLEIFDVSKATSPLLDCLNLAVNAFAHGVGDTVLKVCHDVVDVIFDCFSRYPYRL